MIREYKTEDINDINVLGRDLNLDYIFNEEPHRNCFVYEKSDNIIGFISFDILKDRAEIIDIIVHINHRNQGIGQELLSATLEYMAQNNIKSISLEVKVTNKEAISLYKKNNFKVTTTRKRYYESGRVDAYLMYREL